MYAKKLGLSIEESRVNEDAQRCARCNKEIVGKGYHPGEGHEVYCCKACAEQGPEGEQMTEHCGHCAEDMKKKR
jgi:hypothetical protein